MELLYLIIRDKVKLFEITKYNRHISLIHFSIHFWKISFEKKKASILNFYIKMLKVQDKFIFVISDKNI